MSQDHPTHEPCVCGGTGNHEEQAIDYCDECHPAARLEYLREQLRAERISYGELAELESLA